MSSFRIDGVTSETYNGLTDFYNDTLSKTKKITEKITISAAFDYKLNDTPITFSTPIARGECMLLVALRPIMAAVEQRVWQIKLIVSR